RPGISGASAPRASLPCRSVRSDTVDQEIPEAVQSSRRDGPRVRGPAARSLGQLELDGSTGGERGMINRDVPPFCTVDPYVRDVAAVRLRVPHADGQGGAALRAQYDAREQRRHEHEAAGRRYERVEPQRAEHIPGGHLAVVLV